MYYQLAVPPSRWPRQAIGPRVPRSWFGRLGDPSLDGRLGASGSWAWEDLHQPSADVSLRSGYCQPALAAVMMGDLNGVTVAQRVHLQGLLGGRPS